MYLNLSKPMRADHFFDTLTRDIFDYDFYKGLLKNNMVKEHENTLKKMNILVRNPNFDNELLNLIKEDSNTIECLLLLISARRSIYLKGGTEKIVIINEHSNDEYIIPSHKDGRTSSEEAEQYLLLAEKTGLRDFLMGNTIESSLYDYLNGLTRGKKEHNIKNKIGKMFEALCRPVVAKTAKKYGFEMMEQKPISSIPFLSEQAKTDTKGVTPDFMLIKENVIIAIEVNYFSSHGGSKVSSIMETYIKRMRDFKKHGINLVLITDGNGYGKNKMNSKLYNLFNQIDYVINYQVAQDGILDEVIEDILNTG